MGSVEIKRMLVVQDHAEEATLRDLRGETTRLYTPLALFLSPRVITQRWVRRRRLMLNWRHGQRNYFMQWIERLARDSATP